MKYVILLLLFFFTACSSTTVVQQTTEPVQQVVPVSEEPSVAVSQNTSANASMQASSQQTQQPQQTQPKTPTKGTGKENLKLEHVLVSPLSPEPDENVDVSFDVTNTVTIPISDISYKVQIMKNNQTYKEEKDVIKNISGNESLSFKKSFAFEKGQYQIVILVDPDNEWFELKETDNDKTVLVTVLTAAEKEALKNATKKNTTKKSKNTSSSSSASNTTESKPTSTGKCKDSDGKNHKTAGTCTDEMQILSDFCLGENTLWEWYCDAAEDKCVYEEKDPCVCKQGACVE